MNRLVRVRWLVILLLFSGPLFAGETELEKGVLPSQEFKSLSGNAIGVVIGDAADLLASEGRFGPKDAVAFSSGNSSYRWLYVPSSSQEDLLRFPTQEASAIELPAKIASQHTLDEWKITNNLALVEVQINQGQGCKEADRVFATSLRVIDGQDGYLSVSKVVAAVAKKHRGAIKHQQSAIEEKMQEMERETLQGAKPTGPEEESQLRYITWLPESSRLRVVLVTRKTNGSFSDAIGTEFIDPKGVEKPRGGSVRYGKMYGTAFTTVCTTDKAGRILQCASSLHGIAKEIPPPQELIGPGDPSEPPTS